MSFEHWISQGTGADESSERLAAAFAHAARARAQAERESNRGRRRHSWRARGETVRRTLVKREAERRARRSDG